MQERKHILEEQLNAPEKQDRLEALRGLKAMIDAGELERPVRGDDTNNHVHTTYSFSPYSPAKAVYMAYMAGLATVGIVDHDSISGAAEFAEAGEIIGINTTAGFELRVDTKGIGIVDQMLNNPDQPGCMYMLVHGVPKRSYAAAEKWMQEKIAPYREERNRKMTANINGLMSAWGISIDYDKDVVPLSMRRDNGSVTERHLMAALTAKLVERFGRGKGIVNFFEQDMGIPLSEKVRGMLMDADCPIYDYDVINVLKGWVIGKVYVPATDELVDVRDAVAFAKEIGAIPTLAYLGDIAESPTGDKKAQKLEDDIMPAYIPLAKLLGFEALAYMPARNTQKQLDMCKKYAEYCSLFQISGEDINQPRQNFVTYRLREDDLKFLNDATWALVGHELMSEQGSEFAFCSREMKEKYPVLDERVEYFKKIGLKNRR